MNFLALDVETANRDYSSICQIGIARFEGGRVVDTWSTLVNPYCEFNFFNIRVHGIREVDVLGAPTFVEIYPELKEKISGQITIHHSSFDKIAISQACESSDMELIEPVWLDSVRVARRTWDRQSYRLNALARFLNIRFQHHDALEDAVAAGKVVCHACRQTGLTTKKWVDNIHLPIAEFDRLCGQSSAKSA